MGRRRDHRVRADHTICPDPEGCHRLYHGRIGGPIVGDACECCGQEVIDPLDEVLTWEEFRREFKELENWISKGPRTRRAWLFSIEQWAQNNR